MRTKANRLILIGLGLLTLFSCTPKSPKQQPSPQPTESHLTIVSFNMRQSGADDGENSWNYRRSATLAMMDSLQPDLMGVQEACPDQIEYITSNKPEYGWYGVGREDGKKQGENMAIFYRKETFELQDSCTLWLSETPTEPSFGWDAACRRTATYAYLLHKPTGKHIHYINTHLDHKGLQAQEKGLALIVHFLDSLTNNDHAPILLTGDFNVIPSNPALAVVNANLLSARTSATVTDTIASFNAWCKPIQDAALGDNLKVEKTPLTIDYIYYKGFSACPYFETVTATFDNIPFISDHYPVKAILNF